MIIFIALMPLLVLCCFVSGVIMERGQVFSDRPSRRELERKYERTIDSLQDDAAFWKARSSEQGELLRGYMDLYGDQSQFILQDKPAFVIKEEPDLVLPPDHPGRHRKGCMDDACAGWPHCVAAVLSH